MLYEMEFDSQTDTRPTVSTLMLVHLTGLLATGADGIERVGFPVRLVVELVCRSDAVRATPGDIAGKPERSRVK